MTIHHLVACDICEQTLPLEHDTGLMMKSIGLETSLINAGWGIREQRDGSTIWICPTCWPVGTEWKGKDME